MVQMHWNIYLNRSIRLIEVPPLRVRVDLEVMAMKRYSILSRVPELESHHRTRNLFCKVKLYLCRLSRASRKYTSSNQDHRKWRPATWGGETCDVTILSPCSLWETLSYDVLYLIEKQIIKMDQKSMCFLLRKIKHYLIYRHMQSNLSPTKFSRVSIFVLKSK